MLNTYLLYSYNDIASLFVSALQLKTGVNHFSFVEPSSIVNRLEPLNGIINYIFFSLFDPISAVNLLSISYLLLAFFVTLKLFFYVSKTKVLSVIFAFFYTFSIYNLYRLFSITTDLMQFFMFPLTIYLLIKKTKPVYLSLMCVVGFALSIYTTYMCVMVILFWYVSSYLIKGTRLKSLCVNVCSFIVPLLLVGSILFGTVIIQSLPFFARWESVDKRIIKNMEVKYRPVEDFYNLSLRPWYFFIPPNKSLFFKNLSIEIYQRLKATDYYLADDYMEEEAGGSYMGWHFLLGVAVVYLTLFLAKVSKSPKILVNELENHKELLLISLSVVVGILLISHPPAFTISGVTFYTPNYLIYKVLPVFRTLVRFSAFIYLFVLLVNLILYVGLWTKISNVYRVFLTVGLSVITFVFMSVSVPVINIADPPQEIRYLKTILSTSAKDADYAVYPKASYYSIFWLLTTGGNLANPVDFINPSTGFNANKFSKALMTQNGLKMTRDLGVDYLVVYIEEIALSDRSKAVKFFTKYIGNPIYSREDILIYKF